MWFKEVEFITCAVGGRVYRSPLVVKKLSLKKNTIQRTDEDEILL